MARISAGSAGSRSCTTTQMPHIAESLELECGVRYRRWNGYARQAPFESTGASRRAPSRLESGLNMARPRRVRVAYCLDSFAIGGTELNAVRTAEALDPARIELCVIHLQTRGPLRARYERLGVPMTHMPIPNLYSPRTA